MSKESEKRIEQRHALLGEIVENARISGVELQIKTAETILKDLSKDGQVPDIEQGISRLDSQIRFVLNDIIDYESFAFPFLKESEVRSRKLFAKGLRQVIPQQIMNLGTLYFYAQEQKD